MCCGAFSIPAILQSTPAGEAALGSVGLDWVCLPAPRADTRSAIRPNRRSRTTTHQPNAQNRLRAKREPSTGASYSERIAGNAGRTEQRERSERTSDRERSEPPVLRAWRATYRPTPRPDRRPGPEHHRPARPRASTIRRKESLTPAFHQNARTGRRLRQRQPTLRRRLPIPASGRSCHSASARWLKPIRVSLAPSS